MDNNKEINVILDICEVYDDDVDMSGGDAKGCSPAHAG